MPDLSQTQPFSFSCQGGLVLNQPTFNMQPGQALELENFEPDIDGGYRRIDGFKKFVNHIVPQTSSSTEEVLMVVNFANKIVAARGQKIFSSASTELATAIASDTTMSGSGTITVDSTTGFSSSGTLQINSEIFTYTGVTSTTFTGVTRATSSTSAAAHAVNDVVSESWTERDTSRSSASRYNFERFNFDGNDKLVVVDGNNAPTFFNSAMSATDITSAGSGEVSTAVTGAKFVAAFKDHMFYAGMSSTPQEIVFSVPFDEDNFATGSGAGSIKVDNTITGLKVFRDNLFIFCESRIFKLSGTSLSNFAITPVTRNIGCIEPFGSTIQEFAGDLIFLGPDGLRTVAGTARIGDVEIGTISKSIQSLIDDNIKNADLFNSIVIPDKTQYRLFFNKSGLTEENTIGVICVLKGQQFEFAKLKGIKPSSTDSIVESGDVIAIHGGFDGYVYRQEKGNDFDGTAINGKYRSPDLTFGDPGVRKHMQRVILNYAPEAAISADLFLRYDYESAEGARPNAYPFDSTKVAAVYGVATYGTGTYGGATQPLVRQSVEGSGFALALRVNDSGTTAPYSLKGFGLEYQVGARR
tara:strand:- start:523 stop:2271 length:1749 start_codon:yes stop_codon:yes gene_type:complete